MNEHGACCSNAACKLRESLYDRFSIPMVPKQLSKAEQEEIQNDTRIRARIARERELAIAQFLSELSSANR